MNPDCLTLSWPEAGQEAKCRFLIFIFVFHLNLLKEEMLSYCTFLLGTFLDTVVYAVSFSVLCESLFLLKWNKKERILINVIEFCGKSNIICKKIRLRI